MGYAALADTVESARFDARVALSMMPSATPKAERHCSCPCDYPGHDPLCERHGLGC
jgi:hypothetical protein